MGISAVSLLALALAPAAHGSFITGLSGGEYRSHDASERERWFDETVTARASVIRINLSWRDVVTDSPDDPGDPADPGYEFGPFDKAVVDAAERDLDVLLTIYRAPAYAEGPGRPASALAGTWKPDPDALADFAQAVATRYSGSFQGLPRVRYFQAFNEPNLSNYLSPQWENGSPWSPSHYRRMLNEFAAAVHDVHADNLAVTGGTAPYGDPPEGERMRPLKFWREVLCLRKRGGKLVGASCPEKARFDILAHHPINTSGGPATSAAHPDDVSTPDFGAVRRTLRAAERRNRVAGARHELWATEIWWESDPPDAFRGVALERHARWTQQALYLLWKQGAKAVINLLIRDGPFDPERPLDTIEAGLYFEDGTPKPALTAFRFPLVVDRKSRRTGLAWGKAPATGRLTLQRRGGKRWRPVGSAKVELGDVFTESVVLKRNGDSFRAKVAGEKSLVWVVH